MAPAGPPLPPAITAGLLLCCVATSALTALMMHLYLRPASPVPRAPTLASKSPPKQALQPIAKSEEHTVSPVQGQGGAPNIATKDLQALAASEIPLSLRLDAYFSPERLKDFDHVKLFEGCSHVLAVLDAIHPYLDKFFTENLWLLASTDRAQITTLQSSTRSGSDGRGVEEDSDESDDSDEPSLRRRSSSHLRSRWRLPEWLDPKATAEILIYPGVRSQTFAPQKIINLEEGGAKVARRPSIDGNGATRRPFGWSRSSVSQEDEEEMPKRRLIVLPEALVLGGTFDLSEGSIYIGKQVRIEPNVFIKGPAVIGAKSTLRSGTYIRGDVIVGRNVVLRGEVKNSVIMDDAELCHPGYCGDSICGFKSHFGNQVTTANLSLLSRSNLTINVDGVTYDTGRKKAGVVLGDGSQLGCSSVTDPCTLVQQNTVVYPLTRLRKDVYGSSLLIKNKPMEKGVLEIVPLRASQQAGGDAKIQF